MAVQVLSKGVANIFRNYYPCETHKTAEFCEMMNNFFDIFNVPSSVEGIKTKNSFLKPFASDTDERFEWLRYTFLPYFTNWKLQLRSENILSNQKKIKCSFRDKHMKV